MKGKLLALAAGAALALAGTAQGAYHAVDLGPGRGSDVNSAGMVVGQSGEHAVVWTQSGGMVDLGTLGGIRSAADHVTEAGQVVGYAYVNATDWHTFSWTPAGGMVDVGTLGGPNSSPWDVSDTGQIVGQSNWAGFPPPLRAFSWTAAGGLVDLGVLEQSNTLALAVNDVGQVVGSSGRPFVWSQATGMQTIRPFSGGAADINDNGWIVGWVAMPTGFHALVWPAAGGMIDLGRSSSTAIAINDANEVVWLVQADDGSTHVMFLAPAGQPLDIGTLGGAGTTIPTQYPGLALNDAGQVVGWSQTTDGGSHAFVWSLAEGMVDLGPGQANAISESGLIAGTRSWHATLWAPQTDMTPPSLTVHDAAADATEPTGTIVDYAVIATDDTDPSPAVVCAPASGTHFDIGDTTVECTATDASQNTATATFVVHVRGAGEQATNLADALQTLPYGLATSLAAKLNGPTVEQLRAFVHEVDAQAGKALADEQAAALREAAERVIAVLGG